MNRNIILIALLCLLSIGRTVAQSVTVEAKIDSLQILIGEQAKVQLQVAMDAKQRAVFPAYTDTLVRGVEIIETAKPDTQFLNDRQRMLITQEYIVTSFDSALYYLPPMPVTVDGKEYRSKALALKVYSMPVDTLHPDQFFGQKTVMKAPFAWEDWYGLIGCSFLALPLLGLLIYLIIRIRDNKPIIRKIKVEPKLPPHQAAMKEIERIKNEKVWQKGQPKAYYTELTDTLRTYIKDRFGFNALEMTSSEIIDKLLEMNDKEAISDLKELFQTAFMQNHAINVSGGNKDMHYSLSGGFLDQDGVGIGSGFTRASFRANFDTNINKWVQVGFNTAYSNTKQTLTFSENDVINTALNQFPDVAARNPDGSYGVPEANDFNTSYSNPIFEANMKENRTNNYQLDYNVFVNIKPVKGLNIRVEYGGNRGWGNSYYFVPDYSYGNIKVESQSTRTKTLSKYSSFKQYATYDFDPFKHNHFQIMLGHEAQWGNWESLSGSRKGYISDSLHSLGIGDASTATNSGDDGTPWAIESYFGRLNYNLLERYLLTATLRTDGSSSFGKNNRWGWFPSAALAWRITQEPFMKDVKWLNNWKLRLGWGLVGNQSTGSFAYGATMNNVATAWGTGYYPARFPNPDLKWESTNSWNVGMDFAFLDNRIEFIVDAYLKKTDNLLMEAALPSYVINNDWQGMSAPWVNTGSIENKGIEFTLNTVNINKGDWSWRTGATLSINRNKLTALNSDDATISGKIGTETLTLSKIGGPVGRFYGYNVIGMYKTADDFYQKNSKGEFLLDAAGNKVPTPRPADGDGNMYPIAPNSIWVGDYIFEDVNWRW